MQHRLDDAAGEVRDWVRRRGGAIYVCGSLNGMAQGVDAALRRILGDEGLAALAREGRYRRDVYQYAGTEISERNETDGFAFRSRCKPQRYRAVSRGFATPPWAQGRGFMCRYLRVGVPG